MATTVNTFWRHSAPFRIAPRCGDFPRLRIHYLDIGLALTALMIPFPSFGKEQCLG
jgi:hypothetical protein